MNNNTTTSMFESIKASLSKTSGSGFKNVLKTEIGKTYLVRLMANKNVSPVQTFYQYYHHSWESKSTGQFVTTLCPSTWGDRCVICEQRFKQSKTANTEAAKAEVQLINRKQNWLVNCYVISDGTEPNNNGTVKIFRLGKQVKDIIMQAVDGDDAKDVGSEAMFDLSEKGCNFRIKVEKNEGGYPTYVFSKFLTKGPIEGLTPAKITNIETQAHDLSKLYDTKSRPEMEEMLNIHFFCKEIDDPFNLVKKADSHSTPHIDENDHLQGLEPSTKIESTVASEVNHNQEIEDLVKGL